MTLPAESAPPPGIRNRAAAFVASFGELLRMPRAFWIVNFSYAADGFAYYGILILLGPFLTEQLGISDRWASIITGSFAAVVTIFMFSLGSYAERFGMRRALLASMVILLAGRVLLAETPMGLGVGVAAAIACAALLVMAAGGGIIQTANYSGVKQYSSLSVNSVAFGLNYALMNAGIVVIGFLSSEIRTQVDRAILRRGAAASAPAVAADSAPVDVPAWANGFAQFSSSGIVAVFWFCTAATALMLLVAWLTFTRRAESEKIRPESEQRIADSRRADRALPLMERWRRSPFADARFTYFVFILMPARTLFGYQIHIFGNYVLRAYPESVGQRFEYFPNVINPLTVVILSPLFAALFRRTNLVSLMMVGSLVTALPTFLFCLPEREWLLLAYTVIFSAGEALWQPRFYEFAANVAPEGRMGEFMAAASMPWLMAKFGTGLYSGWMMELFCPSRDSHARVWIMWAIFGVVALISPVGLFAARRWLRAGLRTTAPAAAA